MHSDVYFVVFNILFSSSDLVTGLIALMNSNYSRPVNLGNPEEHTIAEFAQIILDLLGVLHSSLIVLTVWQVLLFLDLYFTVTT